MFDLQYDRLTVPVAGGELALGRWGSGDLVVLAAHGVTANHASFHALADALGEEVTLLAPDLRGRAGSRFLGGPYGMGAHADDVAALLRKHTDRPVVALGHSMGGFVAAVLAARYPDLVSAVVLVDGGLPIDLGPLKELPIDEVIQKVIGPSMDRLAMTFPTKEAYFDFWRPHPALVDAWSPYVERYLEEDLVSDGDVLRSGCLVEAVLADSQSDLREEIVPDSLRQLKQPVVHLRAPRGVMNQEPPLYPKELLPAYRELVPQLELEDVDDVNHFTITLSEHGARQVAAAVRRLGGSP